MKKNVFTLLALLLFVIVRSQCSANFGFLVNANGNVSFTNTSAFTSSNVIYTWNFGDNNTSQNVNPSHTYTNNGNYIVDLLLHDSTTNGLCISNYTYVVSISNATCGLTAKTNTYQLNSNTINFVNASTGTIALTQYTLHYGYVTPQSYFSSHFNVVHTFSAAALYPIQLVAKNSNSCTSVYNASITVLSQTCNLTPNFGFTVNGSNVAFSNSTQGTSSTTVYHWMFANGNTSNAQTPPNQNFLYNGTYTVTLFATDSINYFCGSLITKTINITNAPCFASSQFSMVKDLSAMPSIVWNATPTYSTNVVSAVWNWGDNSTSTGLFPSHTYSSTGLYNICLTVSVSCGQMTTSCMASNINRSAESSQIASVKVLNLISSVKEEDARTKKVVLFPNPNKGSFQLYVNEVPILEIKILDLQGKEVYKAYPIVNEGFCRVNLPEHLEGVYLVCIEGENLKQKERLVIVKD
jgi:PKD repeat protein